MSIGLHVLLKVSKTHKDTLFIAKTLFSMRRVSSRSRKDNTRRKIRWSYSVFILLSGIDAGIHGKVLSSVGSHREAVCQRCCEGFIWNHDRLKFQQSQTALIINLKRGWFIKLRYPLLSLFGGNSFSAFDPSESP